MVQRRIGLWFVGACGGVASTTALGLSALVRGLTPTTGLVSALPQFAKLELDDPTSFVIGGHEVRQATLLSAVRELHGRSSVFDERTLSACASDLEAWSSNIRPGVVFRPNAAITSLADRPDMRQARTPREAIEAIQNDLRSFVSIQKLDQLVVFNAASTEPPFLLAEEHKSLDRLNATLDRATPAALPTSSLYAYAAIDAGFPYVNITPSRGATIPAIEELALKSGVPHAGQDLKTGETLIKSVLAPLFACRNLRVLSWVGHNILGNRDGLVLNDPDNKASKVKSKDSLLAELLGYKPQSLVSIEYIESLDDWKTAWDHIHFEGFLGTKMTMQFTWQGCDSLLAAPLVIDLARFAPSHSVAARPARCRTSRASSRARSVSHEHDFGKQFGLLEEYSKGAAR